MSLPSIAPGASGKNGTVLITGGAGFIGTHLSRVLIENGYSVLVLDLVTPQSPVPGVRYVQGDVSLREDLEACLESEDLKAVYHFAAVSSVPACEEDPVRSFRTNLVGTALLLDCLREKRKSGKSIRAVFSGSSAVYGKLGENGQALKEGLNLPFPVSNYAIQKLAAERLFGTFSKFEGIPSVVFRFFNVYGKGQDPKSPYTGVITTFLSRLSLNQAIHLHGGGIQTRDFVAVEDVVEGCYKALHLPDSECDGQPINLASGERITVQELAETLIRITGRSVPLYKDEPRKGDVLHSLGNIERAGSVLGWRPKVKLEQGLKSLQPSSIPNSQSQRPHEIQEGL
ncbi:MAG: NAD-dependent epimerase/dehydratase family protein [Bdellovibrio sp.]|nr:NAD-dependent epimerase/dehydratase family protein [Bdellovibrio sp.]